MDANLSDMLGNVLSNPKAVEQLKGMAQAFMGGAITKEDSDIEQDLKNGTASIESSPHCSDKEEGMASLHGIRQGEAQISSHSHSQNENTVFSAEDKTLPKKREGHGGKSDSDRHLALISALCPYLSPERKSTAEALMKLLRMMKLTDLSSLLKM